MNKSQHIFLPMDEGARERLRFLLQKSAFSQQPAKQKTMSDKYPIHVSFL
jgi:hypothetical protein